MVNMCKCKIGVQSMKGRHNPHLNEPGYIYSRFNKDNDDWIVLYDGSIAGLKEKGRWVVSCAAHGTLISETNQRRAKKLMAEPEKWCDTCKSIKTPRPTLHIIPFEKKSPEDKNIELKKMAEKIKDNPEKFDMFEEVYGVRPNLYWD